ncbi:MAG: phytanoyl-CoA dioxygenase family protein, partial [Pseudomonadota bacterium]
MTILTDAQRAQFWRDGFLTVENAVSPELLARLRAGMDRWIEESRSHEGPFGEMIDGRARYDVQPGHSAEAPALRRISAPTEISDAYFEAMSNSAMTDMVAELIGPNVKLHHTKINAKQPGSATEVKWHQDFPFTPHSNSDLITALLMIDEVTMENGPLEEQPGSHHGPIHSLWRDGVFAGAVAPDIEADMKASSVSCYGPAGSVCLMHTKVAHGSAPNRSTAPRTLFISVYSAGDVAPCCPNPVPTLHEGLFVRGENPNC